MSSFIHLRSHSDYSLGKSIVKIHELVAKAKAEKMPALCLMEQGNLFGSLEFSLECIKSGIKPLIGIVIKTSFGAAQGFFDKRETTLSKIALIAKNEEGYDNLIKLVSNSFFNSQNSEPHINIQELFTKSKGIIALINPFESPVALALKCGKEKFASELLNDFQKAFREDFFIELIRTSENNWRIHEDWFLKAAFDKEIPLVATNPISFLKAELSNAHDILLCIANGRYVLEDDREKSCADYYFKSALEMEKLFADIPEAITNTKLIATKASIFPQTRKPILPKFLENYEEECLELQRQAREGLKSRIESMSYDVDESKYFERLEFELSVINKMQFPGYFLIVSDFIKWSKRQKIPVGPGRGSGAGSIVAWALEVTDLDPIKFGLLFERFLNPERVSMPDFDIDFCQERRDEVIDYVKKKYGEDKVAQIITFGKLQARAVLRDVGRVLQIPYGLVDRICKMIPNNPANPVTLSEAIALDSELRKMRDDEPDVARLLSISLELEGINRHVSTHAAGIIIADRPLIELVPLYLDSNSVMQTIQYSLKYADLAGLMKFDFLGLKTITMIERAIRLIKENRGIELDLSRVDYLDQKTYNLLSSGYTIGIFQFEGAGVKDAIKQLKPDCLGDLIALTSLYRPGPMDNIPSYINRKHGLEEPDYIHEKLKDILKETYGIIIYQEQVMEIARILGGYTLGQADVLRRAMGKKNKQEMEQQSAIFVNGCTENGLDREYAIEIFALMEKFASYGFNKSHAAAYAVISYQTAYLKAHYTAEFLAASMNLDIGDTGKIWMFSNEAKIFGIEVLLPDINASSAYFKINDGKILYGLAAIKGVGIKIIDEIEIRKNKNGGEFKNLGEFISLCSDCLNKRAMESLVKAGAFDSLHANRGELYENLENLIQQSNFDCSNKNQGSLFFEDINRQEIILTPKSDWDKKVKLSLEFSALGFYLSSHPLDEYRDRFARIGITEIERVPEISLNRGQKIITAGVLSSKKVKSSKRGRYAFLQLTDQGSTVDLSIFDEKLLIENNKILEVGNAIVCEVEIRNEDGNNRILITKLKEAHKFIKESIKYYQIHIRDTDEIDKIKKVLNYKEGVPVTLNAELKCGSIIRFDLEKLIYISSSDAEMLRDDNIIIIDNY